MEWPKETTTIYRLTRCSFSLKSKCDISRTLNHYYDLRYSCALLSARTISGYNVIKLDQIFKE